MAKTLQEMMAEHEKRAGLPAGALASINKQETGGKDDYIKDPSKYHYELNKDGKRIAGHTGKVSTAFGPFGILESTGRDPGYGVAPLKSKDLEEQVRFAADYLAGRSKAAGSLQAGLAGYGEGDAYAKQVLGRMSGSGAVPAVAPKPDLPAPTTYDWPILPTAANVAKAGAAPADTWESKTADRRALAAGSSAVVGGLQQTGDASIAQTEASIGQAVQAQTERDAVGFGDVFQATRHDPRMQPMFTLLDTFNKEQETIHDGWTYNEHRDDIESGHTDEERAYLRENVRGPQSLAAAKAQLQYRADLDRTYANAGGFVGFAGQMAGGMLDPLGFAAGVGVGKALQGVGIGSRALANAGRPGAAAGSFLLENALANVSVEVMQDALGEVKGTGDYAMAAATGVIMGLPFARGASRMDHATHIRNLANTLREQGIREQVDGIAKDAHETGITDPTTLARRQEEREIESITRGTPERNPLREQIVPTAVSQAMRDAAEGIPFNPDTIPTLTEAVTIKDVPTLTDAVTIRQVPTLTDAVTIKEAPSKPPTTVGEVLEAVGTEEAYWLLKMMTDERKGTPVTFEGETPYYLETGDTTNLPKTTLDNLRAGKLDDYDKHIVVHEAVHAATSKALTEVAEGGGSGAQRKAAQELQSIFDEFTGKKHAEAGAQYAAKNLDEFLAQLRSDPSTKAAMQAIPSKGTTLWERFVQAIGRMLGLDPKSTRFDDAIRELGNLIQAAPLPENSAAFKRWFKNSKVVDANGKPLRLFHGTSSDISKFSKGVLGQNTGANSAKHGFFFTTSADVASAYAQSAPTSRAARLKRLQQGIKGTPTAEQQADLDAYFKERKEGSQYVDGTTTPSGANLMPVYLSLQNMKEIDMKGLSTSTGITHHIEAAKAAGHDGIVFRNTDDTIRRKGVEHLRSLSDVYVAFEPNQIKSALGNSGEYLVSDDRIHFGPARVAPQQQTAYNQRFSQGLYDHAKDFMARNPIDTKRLKVLTAKIGGLSDGLVLAASKNPIMQMMASLVAETTTGAAGRKASVAIRAHMLNKKFMGNAIPEFTSNFDVWANANNVGIWDRMVGGEGHRKFGKAVYIETVNRRQAGYVPNSDQSIVKAADALEGVFERARKAQVDAGTLGANGLPTTSRGYMPQALDGAKLQTLTKDELDAFHSVLSTQFQQRLGWDKRFADTFAPYYTERVRKRAQGSKQFDMTTAGGDGNAVIRDTLIDMTNDPKARDMAEAANAYNKGLGHTKKRLDLDLQEEFVAGKQLMDVYVTDPMALARNYSRRNGGSVAFTESGVLGQQGIVALREAAGHQFENGTAATPDELKAYDRVVAEIMGNPVEGAVISAGASNLAAAVQVSKLGSLVFTQAAETVQLIHSLGVASALNGISSLPRMLGEVGRLKKGLPANNHILTSIETWGGEFGTDSYKMVAPLDPPDNSLNQYMDQSGLVTRLLRGAGHLQSKISGFRGLMAAQHRMAAEQVVMKAARYIRDGGNDINLKDMGFDDALVQAMRNDLPNIAQFDASGKLTSFDLSKVTDAATAEQFVQSVHRGVSQIIQGTFAGERNAWFHNDYLKLMLQLRTFGLTATEKQWGRTQMNHGTMYTVGALAGQMALVLPIHMARVHAAAQGREDKEQFLKDNLSPVALARATMNYSSLSGLMGDMMDVGTGIYAGWGSDEAKELVGARQQATGVANIIPALGMVDAGLKTVQGKSNLYNTVKQLPFSNLWYMVPLINLMKE